MQRKVSARDVQEAVKLMKRGEASRWWVCDDYHIRRDEIVAEHPPYWLDGEVAPPWNDKWSHWRPYEPLEEAPDLFLKFAALSSEPNFGEAALAFSHRYGLPGGTSDEPGGRPDKIKMSEFWEEVKRARIILEVYEAALNRDEDWGRLLLLLQRSNADLSGEYYPGDDSWPVLLSAVGLGMVSRVTETVRTLCEPGFIMHGVDLSNVEGTWHYDNLLGAMYLQMYWLMTSGKEVARCEYCGRIISLARTRPHGRKRRRDRKFCNDACRQAHHRSKNKA